MTNTYPRAITDDWVAICEERAERNLTNGMGVVITSIGCEGENGRFFEATLWSEDGNTEIVHLLLGPVSDGLDKACSYADSQLVNLAFYLPRANTQLREQNDILRNIMKQLAKR